MGSGLSIGGLSSGLDTAAIIKQILAIESQPITVMKNKQTRLNNQSNLISSIKLNMMTLQSAASDLTLSSAFGGRKVSSSNTTTNVATAVAQNGAVNTSYRVKVTSVATTTTYVSSKLGGAAVPATKTTLMSNAYLTSDGTSSGTALDLDDTGFGAKHSGTFTINNADITVSAGDSLNSVLAQINNSSAGVTATISNKRLLLTQKVEGAANNIVVAGASNGLIDSTTATITQGVKATATTAVSSSYLTSDGTAAGTVLSVTDTAFGAAHAGTLKINGVDITVASGDSIKSVINKINASSAHVKASISADHKLVLTDTTAGANTMTIDGGGIGIIDTSTTTIGLDNSKTTVVSNGYLTGIDPDDTTFGATHLGTFTINGKSVTVSSGDSINGVLAKINTSGAGVTASINNNQLVLTNNTVGAGSITVTGSITDLVDPTTPVSITQGTDAIGAGGAAFSAGSKLVKEGTAFDDSALNLQFGAGGDPNNVGYFTINGAKIMVTDADTLNTVVNKITSSNAGVTATIESGKVVLTQKTVGAKQKIDIVAGKGTVLDSLGIAGTLSIKTPGEDADESKAIKDVKAFSGMGSGYFSINGTYIYVDDTKDTLNSIISKINQSGAGVIASFNTDTDQISISSKTPGNTPITFGTYGVPGATDSINFVGLADLTASSGPTGSIDATTGGKKIGAEAKVTVNDTAVITKNGSATINGVIFSFNGEGETTITVQNDTDTTVKKVQAFIDAYNTVNDALQSAISQKPDQTGTDATQGILFGDSMLTTLSYNLRSLVSQTVSGTGSKYMQLSQVGITTGATGSSVDSAKSGKLTLDTAKLTQAVTDDPDAVAALFGKSNRVFAEKTTMDGSSFIQLSTHPLSTAFIPQVTVGGVVYSAVKDANSFSKTEATAKKQFWVDYKTGTINFYAAPTAGTDVLVNYDYDTSSSGMALRFKNLVASYTRYGGSFDARIGSQGSIPNEVKDINDRINRTQDRIDKHQATIQRQFTAMESMLNSLKSQQSSFNSLLGSLSSSSKS